jgi:uncharacterized alkaline shock family protein YloU
MEQEQVEVGGALTMDDEVVASIAGVAAREVEGVHSLGTASFRRTFAERVGRAEGRARGVEVQMGTNEAAFDITLNVIYGYNIPKVADKVRQNVAERVLNLCGLATKEINIDIVGIEFPEKEVVAPERDRVAL